MCADRAEGIASTRASTGHQERCEDSRASAGMLRSSSGVMHASAAREKWQLGSYPGYAEGTPRSCPPIPPSQTCCPYTSFDYNGDGEVGGVELAVLLADWGSCAHDDACWGDLNRDGLVDAGDLQILFGIWGRL